MMKQRTTLFLAIAFPVVAALLPSAVDAQLDVPDRSLTYVRATEAAPTSPTRRDEGEPLSAPTMPEASGDPALPDPGFWHVTLAAGAGALVGGSAAALALGFPDGRGSGAGGGALVVAGILGGGTIGAVAATKRWSDSLAGSAVGTAGALLAALAVDKAAESAGYRLDGFGLTVGYALIHGALTALVVRK
jgi:hypothetical protein